MIIKNCDCYKLGACCTPNADRLYCKDITNCVLKRIVERADLCLCPEVVELLEIEECENE